MANIINKNILIQTKKEKNISLMNQHVDFSKDKVLTIMLQSLIERASLKSLMYDVEKLLNKKEEEIEIRNKLPLSNFDILCILYKILGPDELLKCLFRTNDKNKKEGKQSKQKDNQKENKFLTIPLNSKTEKEKGNDNIEITKYKNVSHSTQNEEYIQKDDDFVIELPNEDDSKKTDIIINLDEKESSTSCENYNIKSEVKCIRNNNITKKEFDKTNIQINKGLKSETKIYPFSKHNIKEKKSNLSYHYTLNQGNLYKYRFIKYIKDNVALFSCDDVNCECFAEYELKNQVFLIKKCHSFSQEEHDYIKEITTQDSNILDHMKNKNIGDIQLTK